MRITKSKNSGDVNTLTLNVSQLKSELAHEKATTKLVIENFEKDGKHLKESIDSKFDVLVTRLDLKIAALENRLPAKQSPPTSLENA